MSMWEPFTERAKRSIVLAQQEAQRLRENYIAPHHLLLGLLQDGGGPVSDVLRRYGLTPDVARKELPAETASPPQDEMVFTPDAKRVIEYAFSDARQRGEHFVGPQHLMSALVQIEDARTIAILRAGNVPLKTLAAEVYAAASANPEPPMQIPQRGEDITLTDDAIISHVRLLGELLRKRSEREKLDERIRPMLSELHREMSEIAKREGWKL